jgi:hypothetical protein
MNGRRGAPDGTKALRIAGQAPNLPGGFTATFTSRYTDTKEKP